MPILKRLKEVLDDAKIPYEVYNHALAYTAQEIAAKQHVSGNELAKVVMLKAAEKLVMGVVRGNDKISLRAVEDSLDVRNVWLATEDEFIARFPECEIGAMPPFGRVFGLPVYLDRAFAAGDELFFESGTHREEVSMPMAEYIRVERPAIAPLARVPLAA